MELNRINTDSIVDMIFHLKWKSDAANHTDCYQASRINLWRDYLPPFLIDEMRGKQAGEKIEARLRSDDFLPAFNNQNIFQIKRGQFDGRLNTDEAPTPGVGRFYPKGILKNVAGVFNANVQPFRCAQLNNGNITVDFNHPLAGKELVFASVIGKVAAKDTERGGSSVDWMAELANGIIARLPSSIKWGLAYMAASTLPSLSAVDRTPIPFLISKYSSSFMVISFFRGCKV